jgi:hypothetical protein
VIRDPVYIGKVNVKEYGNDPEQILMGKHPAIIPISKTKPTSKR